MQVVRNPKDELPPNQNRTEVQNVGDSRTLSPSKCILMYRPPSTNTDDGCAKQPNNERPMEDISERRHRNPSEEFSGFQVGGGQSDALIGKWRISLSRDFHHRPNPINKSSTPPLSQRSFVICVGQLWYHSDVNKTLPVSTSLSNDGGEGGIGESERTWIASAFSPCLDCIQLEFADSNGVLVSSHIPR